ncbi:MAG: helix-turn-helix domain-containing protein [bacterium]
MERALALLAEVCDAQGLSLAAVARLVELPASTALRLLRTLEASAFVRRDLDGTFHPGPRVIQLGAMAFGRQSLATLAEPALRRIVAACGETAYVHIAGPPGSALTIAMVEGTWSVRHASWVGHRVATPGTALEAALGGTIGPDGFVALPSPAEPDVTAVASPIERPIGGRVPRWAVAGVISVVGPTYRLTRQRVDALGAIVSHEARELAGAFAALDTENAGVGAVTAQPQREVSER